MKGNLFGKLGDKRTWFSFIVLVGLFAFDLFNYATTQAALSSFITDMVFGIGVAQVLAIAFCTADLGGLTSIFTYERGLMKEPWWVWMFTAGWLITSTINAFLTWWAILIGMQGAPMSNPLYTAEELYKTVPVAIAAAVWIIRLLLVGSTIVAWDHPTAKKQSFNPANFGLKPLTKPQPSKPPQKKDNGTVSITSPFGD